MKEKDFYLTEAERVRAQAQTMTDKHAHEMLINIANTYERLAELAARHPQPPHE
jgi:hypothetical protein